MQSHGSIEITRMAPETQNVCHICREPMKRQKAINDNFTSSLCESCDLLATNVSFHNNDIAERNKEMYRLEHRLLTYYLRNKEFQSRYKNLLRHIEGHVPGKIQRVLEMGSNIGYFANFIKSRGIHVETVEINESLRAFQQLAYGIASYKSLDDLDDRRRYDLVVMIDVLEHIPDPVDILKRLRAYVNDEGVVFIQSPHKNSLSAKIAGKRWNWWSAPDHLYHFSGKSLTLIARKAGFETVSLRYVSPLLDDLVNLPAVGRLFTPIRVLSRWINVNPAVPFGRGSLIQVLIRPAR